MVNKSFFLKKTIPIIYKTIENLYKLGKGHISYSAAKEIYGQPVHCIFSTDDLPDYHTFSPEECPHCRNKEKIDAIVNGFGYSEL